MRIRKKKTITAPFDVGDIHAGDQVERDAFYRTVSVALQQLRDKIDDLTVLLGDKERETDDLRREVQNLRYDINEFYTPVNPYRYNGVSPRDF